MAYLCLLVCALGEAFLLRFLLAMAKDLRNAKRKRAGEPRRSRSAKESAELFPMALQSRNKMFSSRHQLGIKTTKTKTAAIVLAGAVLFTFAAACPLPAQEATGPSPAGNSSAQTIPPELAKQIEALTKRVEQLEQQLRQHEAAEQPTTVVQSVKVTTPVQTLVEPAAPIAVTAPDQSSAALANKPTKIAPFSDWDWTWLNGNPRNKDTAYDSKFFTPEIRADITYNYDFNKPIDNSIGGSSEIFRANEIQLEQLGLGGDFHYDNVRARFMTQYGMYSATTPRNDPSLSLIHI